MRLHPQTVSAILDFVTYSADFSVAGMLRESGSPLLIEKFFDSLSAYLSEPKTQEDIRLTQFSFKEILSNMHAFLSPFSGTPITPAEVALTLANIASRAFTEMDLSRSEKRCRKILKSALKETKKGSESQNILRLIKSIETLARENHDFWVAYEKLILIGRFIEEKTPIALEPNCISKLIGSCLFNALSEKGVKIQFSHLKSLYSLFDQVVKRSQFATLNDSKIDLDIAILDISSSSSSSGRSTPNSGTPREGSLSIEHSSSVVKTDLNLSVEGICASSIGYPGQITPAFQLSKLKLDTIVPSINFDGDSLTPPPLQRPNSTDPCLF